MNKKHFSKVLQERSNLNQEKSMMVISILEKHFLVGNNN